MPELLSADHIAAQQVNSYSAFEPQRKNNFTLRITVPGVEGTVIQQSLHSFPFPKEANEPIIVNFGNEQRKVAGRATYDNLQLVVKDYADRPVMKTLIAWRRKVYTPADGKIHLASEYKANGNVDMFAPDGTLVRTWDLKGIWPSSMDPGGGAMDENSQNLITITLAIDKALEGQNLS
jgi:hypothetical protein